jgi:protein SPT2
MTKSLSASSAPSTRPAPRPPAAYPPAQPARKRPRSPSYDDSPSPPAPSKKRTSAQHREDFDDSGDVRDMIWEMFGKKRGAYTGMDVFSDDEDMEADAYSLEHEEAKRLVPIILVSVWFLLLTL